MPCRVIGVLNLQRRHRAGLGFGIKRGHLSRKNAHRPSIANGVMHGDQQDVLFGSQPRRLNIEQWPGSKLEWTPCVFSRQSRQFALAVASRKGSQIEAGERDLQIRNDFRHGRAIARRNAKAQGLLPADHLIQRPAQAIQVERSNEP